MPTVQTVRSPRSLKCIMLSCNLMTSVGGPRSNLARTNLGNELFEIVSALEVLDSAPEVNFVTLVVTVEGILF